MVGFWCNKCEIGFSQAMPCKPFRCLPVKNPAFHLFINFSVLHNQNTIRKPVEVVEFMLRNDDGVALLFEGF